MGSSAHPLSFCETLILERVRSTIELCAVIEAAQCARVFLYAEPESSDDALAIEEFIDAFATATEGWSEPDVPNKAPFLDLLRCRLQELERLGLYVHQSSIERDVTFPDGSEVALAIAVIGFGRDPMPTRTVVLPAQLRACEEADDDDEP